MLRNMFFTLNQLGSMHKPAQMIRAEEGSEGSPLGAEHGLSDELKAALFYAMQAHVITKVPLMPMVELNTHAR